MSATTRETILFPTLTAEQIDSLRGRGEVIEFQPDELIYSEGEPARNIHIVLEGAIKITKRAGGQDMVLAIHHPGGFAGDLSVLTGGAHLASARAVEATRALQISSEGLRSILSESSEAQELFLTVMTHRVQDADMIVQQREKLASLGALSAGLAHEMNNPASAARSAAQSLRPTFVRQQEAGMLLCEVQLAPAHRARLCSIARRPAPMLSLDPLDRSELEETLIDWMERHDIHSAWSLAPILLNAGVNEAELDSLAADIPSNALGAALAWLCATLEAYGLIGEIENGTERISTLVKAVKEYTYMDQAPQQEIDVHEGLENTLIILAHKLRKNCICVKRDYGSDLPTICAHGSALNQVWTNLIDNAVDALSEQEEPRKIQIRTRRDGDSVLIVLEDNGPGIPPHIQSRIFEPFFTTKGVGQGTGLGLDITYRIVVKRHHGNIHVVSRPGETRFIVRLPEKSPV